MARKDLFRITDADTGRTDYLPPAPATPTEQSSRKQAYRQGKRAVMFFLPDEAFSQMHVILARQGRRKVQSLMEELIDDWFRRENGPRMTK